MKRLLGVIALVICVSYSALAGVVVLEGHYQGENLYVKNPFAGSGVGFCVFEVMINGEVTTDEVNSSAFEIDFANFQLKIGDPVIVKIMYKDDCKPKVINPEVLRPKSTFEIVDMEISGDGLFSWTTKNETGELPFIIEQKRWNKWVKVGEVEGKGGTVEHSYKFKVTPHSGENNFRVKQLDHTGRPRYSPSTNFSAVSEVITFSPIKVKKELKFSGETLYEIYDRFGNLVKRGYSGAVDVASLDKGIYYLNYDNKMENFLKK